MADVAVRCVGRLPDDLTSFVGRRWSTTQVKRLVSSSRLVTLTGVAGVGKSRLATHVAREMRRSFPDGVWLIEVSRVQDPALFDRTVFSGLGLRDQSSRDLVEVLTETLADKRLLLVLDGCEHLLDKCGRLTGGLLAGAPDVHVLVTSRAPLGIGGERIWPVPPMSVAGVEGAVGRLHGHRDQEALHLFADRAAAVQPGFEVGPDNELAVARLCQQLDGLPLAIELAAVWTRSLSVEEILARLSDRYQLLTGGDRGAVAHHQTLRAAVEWSFDLCSSNEQTVWQRLSVFSGGFELQAAEEVCSGCGLTRDDVFAGVAGLVEKSVLAREDRHDERARYRLLRTIREYGQERLGQDVDRLRLRRKHRDHYLALAERAESEWFGPNQVEWLDRLRREQENLWAALEFCLEEPGEGHEGLRLVSALRFYWVAGGVLRAGRYWLDRTLRSAPETSSERARVLVVDALISGLQGEVPRARALLHEGRELGRLLRDESVLSWAAHVEGSLDVISDHVEEADFKLSEAISREQMVRPDGLAILSLANLALVSVFRGETERAAAWCERCLQVCEEHGEQWARSWAEAVLGLVLWARGDVGSASAHLRDALRRKRSFNDLMGALLCVEILAWLAAEQNRMERAGKLLSASDRLWRPVGKPLFGVGQYRRWHEEYVRRVRAGGGRPTEVEHAPSFDAVVAYALEERRDSPAGAQEAELTRREREVAELVAEGLSNRRIAERLVIAKRTADSHIEHILVKLGFTSRAQIAAWVTGKQRPDGM